MPRGVYSRKKSTPKKAAAPKRPVSRPRRKSRNTPGVVDIPTISASSLRSSISDTPAETGGALVTKLSAAPSSFSGDKMLDASEVLYAVLDHDNDCVDSTTHRSMEAAVEVAKEYCEEHMDNEGHDDCNAYIYQLVATVECEKPTGVKTTVSVLGASPT